MFVQIEIVAPVNMQPLSFEVIRLCTKSSRLTEVCRCMQEQGLLNTASEHVKTRKKRGLLVLIGVVAVLAVIVLATYGGLSGGYAVAV